MFFLPLVLFAFLWKAFRVALEWHSTELSLILKAEIKQNMYVHIYTHILLLSLLLAQFPSTVPISDTPLAVSWALFHLMGFLSRDNSVGVWKCVPGMQIEPHMNIQSNSKVIQQQASSLPICTYMQRGSWLILSWFDKPIASFLLLWSWDPTIIIMKWFHKHDHHVLNICDSIR